MKDFAMKIKSKAITKLERAKLMAAIEPWSHLIHAVKVGKKHWSVVWDDNVDVEVITEIFPEVYAAISDVLSPEIDTTGELRERVKRVLDPWPEIKSATWPDDVSRVEFHFEDGVCEARQRAITQWAEPALKRALKRA
jgi:hypothetical protein